MKEHYYDKLLNIKTAIEQRSSHGVHYYRYEPTPYSALEELFHTYEVKSNAHFVDFGCGKGRLVFYLHHFFKASVVGVEMNDSLFEDAQANLKNYIKRHKTGFTKITFRNSLAEDYPITESDNCFYFFNPFSIQIFMRIVGNILRSFERTPRRLELLLYYPSEDYIYFLENETPFELGGEVVLNGLYESNPYEHFLIYKLSGEVDAF